MYGFKHVEANFQDVNSGFNHVDGKPINKIWIETSKGKVQLYELWIQSKRKVQDMNHGFKQVQES